ncbi:MAG: alpha/beta fold hydrolase [Candidatus Melainabacteria bacterium]|nr:alpha/beta fold hydrolase [Candidatus Melainabacteria bacterium]
MHNSKITNNSALATFIAVGFACSTSAAIAAETTKVANAAIVDREGAKQVRLPSTPAIIAPLLEWAPPACIKPRLAILCIHGFSMHKGTYTAFGKEMAKDGIATYALDMRGFGERKEIAGKTELDFDGSLADIKVALQRIHKKHADLPVIILGESMGGAIALRATALFPELVAGLISSVPAKDRFSLEDGNKVGVKAGLQTMLGGFNKQMTDSAMAAVNKISEKEELRNVWKTDPLMRTSFSPKEFVQLDTFMSGNLDAAAMVKDTPVLFIQGSNDKLIRPAGTWKLFERLSTPNRQMVLSKNSEHLIFEEGQFNPEDIKFVLSWIDSNVAPLDPAITGIKNKLPVVASNSEYSATDADNSSKTNSGNAGVAGGSGKSGSVRKTIAIPVDNNPVFYPASNFSSSSTSDSSLSSTSIASSIPAPPPASEFKNRIAISSRPKISYWIELNRNGKIFRCNNQTEFKTGDAIRFHLIPETDGYAYLVMKAGTTGKSDLLFPNKAYGTENHLKAGKDYAIPEQSWMQFDSNPGTEKLGLVFAPEKFDVTEEMIKSGNLTCFATPANDGKKEVCLTRMKLSWDDPNPVMIPDDFSPISQVASPGGSSLVRLTSTTGEMVSASIQLFHGK